MARALRLTGPGAAVALPAAFAAALVVPAVAAAYVVVAHPGQLRLLFALLIFGALLTVLLARPRVGLVAVVGWLFYMGLTRRLLIAPAGWAGMDPLLLVSPALAGVMALKLFALDRRPLAPDRLSKWVVVVLALAALQSVNPLAGSIAVGLGGFLFVGIPLIWFLVARELASDELLRDLSLLVLGSGVVVAVYGLLQTEIGFFPWDQAWLEVTNIGGGYSSLNVGDTVRSFGTFASSAEYAIALGSALAIAVAWSLRGHGWALLAIPIIATALFLASGRSALIMSIVASIVVVALNTRRAGLAAIVTVGTIGLAVGAMAAFSGQIADAGRSSGDLASHQLEGLSDPLNPDASTLTLHFEMLVDGFESGFRQPLGYGTGASNNASNKLGGGGGTSAGVESRATEVDVSNAFVSWGLVGGIAYLGVVVLILRRVVRLGLSGRFAALPVAGVLVACNGAWLIGGNYGMCALVWICAGWLAWADAGSEAAT